MSISIRPATPGDAQECGRICHAAFRSIAEAHNFPPDFPNGEIAAGVLGMIIEHPHFYGVVAELDGKIVGSNFLDERSSISGVGPITVDPEVQNRGIGARLMRAVMERSAAKGFAGIRLVQAGYHCRSLSLYSKLGFEVREHLVCMNGKAIGGRLPGRDVRSASEADIPHCNELCRLVHGADRGGELRDAVAQGVASIVERDGRISGYTTQLAFFGHTIGRTTEDVMALIAAAGEFRHPGILVPSRNGELMRWCFSKGLRVTQPLTLMSMGLYSEPAGAWLPSILY